MIHTHELLKEIKLFKLNAWETDVCKTIKELRMKEVRQMLFRNLTLVVACKKERFDWVCAHAHKYCINMIKNRWIVVVVLLETSLFD